MRTHWGNVTYKEMMQLIAFSIVQVLEVKMDEKMREFSEDYYLLKVKPATSTHPSVKESSEGSRRTSTTEKGEKQVEGFFLKAGPLVKLDSDFISDLTNITNDSKLN